MRVYGITVMVAVLSFTALVAYAPVLPRACQVLENASCDYMPMMLEPKLRKMA